MKNKYIYIVLVFIVLLFLGGCQPAMPANTQSLPPRFNRFIDEEAEVVCWHVYDGTIGGLSCLPLSSTKLGQ
jgi:hypothetical protein